MHDDYMNTTETADFLGVTKQTVIHWRKKGLLMPDVIGHGKNGRSGVYYYSKERILQLASVYRKPNENAKRTEKGKQRVNEPQTEQDKKNYASEGAEKNFISANNSNANFTTIVDEKQKRIAELVNFFNQLYGKITAPHFAYLITFKNGIETHSFAIADETQREAMAQEAIELTNNGFDVWHAVNPVSIEPTFGKRGDEFAVSYQTAIVVDIDIRSVAHKGDPSLLAADFEEAKSFLPFSPSLIIFSGYGLHAYYIFNESIKITNENREELKRRNNLLLDVIRARANGKKIDGVGDLPRVLRTPCTFNFKLGTENAPICHIVEDSGLRFSPSEIDEKLNTLTAITPLSETQAKTAGKNYLDFSDDDPDLKEFRIRRMLDFINPSTLTYDEWLAVGMALKNIGYNCSDWEQWSRSDERFKDGECQYKWNGFDRDGYDIGTLYLFASQNGYDAKETFRQWCDLQATSKTPTKKNVGNKSESIIDKLKAELHSVKKALADFDIEKNSALEHLKNVETFDSDSIFSEDVLNAAAFAKLFDKKAFSDFKSEITLFNRKTKEKKASVNEWSALVRDKASEIHSRQNDLLTRHNEIQAQIQSLAFIAQNDDLQNFSIPPGYSFSINGIEKVAGESLILVCRNPVIIKAKTFSVDKKISKLTLAYMTPNGNLKALPPTEAAIIFNRNKLVDLANNGLPVTSSNANLLVDYLDAFNAQNENNFSLTYTVPRCGWYTFGSKNYFIDPRRNNSIIDEDKNISVVVDSLSLFAKSLRQKGNLEAWKKIYYLAKKSPVARIMVAAAIAPILLKILGERNFLLYVCAPTRAGKTTALYLAASAIGDEKMIRSFDATKNGLAGAAADVNDFAFLVDEKQVADSKLKEQLDTLVYALANGLGRTKLNKDSTLRKLADWRTIAIMTGETQLLSDNVTGGANTRLLTISFPKEILSAEDCRIIHDTIKGNHGLAFPLVIDKIFQLGFETLRKEYQALVALFTTKYPDLLSEYCRYMAVLTLADAILNATLTDTDTLPLDDAIQNTNAVFKLIPSYVEISDTARERDFILGFIAQNQNRFIGGNVQIEKMQTIYGKFTKDYVYITVAALKKACTDEGFDYKKVAADLIEDGFFVPDDKLEKGYKNPRSTVKVWLAKTTTNCYRFSTQAFKACVSDLA